MPFKNMLKEILDKVASNELDVESAISRLGHMPFDELKSANYDWHRPLRNGFSEVVFGQGKTKDDVLEIARHLKEKRSNLLVTRIGEDVGRMLEEEFGEGDYQEISRTYSLRRRMSDALDGLVVVCGGTADIPVAQEACRTASFFGAEPKFFFDIGVAGLPRLMDKLPQIRNAKVVIAIAGLEGALPSVIGGLVEAPVIAVPTSVGYGTADGGKTALFAMLTSCAEGISVVNIDNGFGAACAAVRILRSLI